MQLTIKRIGGPYATAILQLDNTVIDMGTLNREEASKLLGDFQSAVEELEWFLRVSEE